MSVVSHYRKKLDKEDLKRLSKEVRSMSLLCNYLADSFRKVAKKLVRGDYKHGKVRDPTAKLESKHERTVKKYVKDFMDKAVLKKAARDKDKTVKKTQDKVEGKTLTGTDTPETPRANMEKEDSDDEMVGLSDDGDSKSHEVSPAELSAADLKRKREEDGDVGSPKKTRVEMSQIVPPPPPPPPVEDMPADADIADITPVDDSVLVNELVTDRVKQEYFPSPMQLATPPTTTNGSCDHDSDVKDGGRDVANGRKNPLVEINGNA